MRLQALENRSDLTLESWEHVFPRKLLCRLKFRDSAISPVHLYALRLRVDDPDELYTRAEPLGDFVFHLIRGIIG